MPKKNHHSFFTISNKIQEKKDTQLKFINEIINEKQIKPTIKPILIEQEELRYTPKISKTSVAMTMTLKHDIKLILKNSR